MEEETRQALAIVAFIIFFPVMMVITPEVAEALHFEVREVKEN